MDIMDVGIFLGVDRFGRRGLEYRCNKVEDWEFCLSFLSFSFGKLKNYHLKNVPVLERLPLQLFFALQLFPPWLSDLLIDRFLNLYF